MYPSAAGSPEESVTRLLIEWKSGSKEPLDLLTPFMYSEVRRQIIIFATSARPQRSSQPRSLTRRTCD